MAVKLDRSTSGIVIYCDEHPWWRAFRFLQDDAWEVACRHEEAEHPDDERQRTARRVRQHRAAADTPPIPAM